MYILCHNKVLIQHFLVRTTWVYELCLVLMALHSLYFSDLFEGDTKGDMHLQHEGASSQHVGAEARVPPLQRTAVLGMTLVTDQGQGRLHILPRSFDFLFQNFKKHHFHVYLHPSLDYTRVSPRFWDSATVISIIVIKLAKTLDDFFYYFIGFMELGFFSTTVMNEVLFSIPGVYILK